MYRLLFAAGAAGLLAATSLRGSERDGDIVILDDFIVQETAQTAPESLSPTSWSLKGVLGEGRSLVETPRAVTALTPEAMRRMDIRNLEDLPKAAAGAERINFFGLAGTPVLRGTRAGLYFNGMLRAYQRNEMPTSFGSTDSLAIVKGPAPTHFAPTLVGGYVNMLPKQPFYEQAQGAAEMTVGRWNNYRAQLDYGAPFLWRERPAAYRVSLTGQQADSYFDNVENNFESIYIALKTQIRPRITLFAGAEYYNFRSSEAPGINRPTQQLIDTGAYVIGEPADLTSSAWGGRPARTLLQFPFNTIVNPALHALSIPGDVARDRIPAELRAHMIDLNDPAAVAALYTLRPEETSGFAHLRPIAARELEAINRRTQDRFVYTPEYFTAGGEVLTDNLPRNQILSDPRDHAHAESVIAFLDVDGRGENGWSWSNRSFFEGMDTDKYSTYGFAFRSQQALGENQTRLRKDLADVDARIEVGASFRLSHAHMVQDFDAEPFSRRDLTQPEISPNTVVPTGADLDPNGGNLWSTFGGASGRSRTFQTAIFGQADWQVTERLRLDLALRAERAEVRRSLPTLIDNPLADAYGRLTGTDTIEFLNGALHATYEVAEDVFLYSAVQRGRSLAPGDGGVIFGTTSFPTADLVEAGVKSQLLDNKLLTSLSVYRWNQSIFSTHDAYARPLRGEGVEFEAYLTPIPELTLIAHFTAQRVTMREDGAGFGALPQTEEEWALNGGILNANSREILPNNPDGIYAGSPEFAARLFGLWEPGNGWGFAGGISWRDAFWSDVGRTHRIPSVVLADAQIFYRFGQWEVGLLVDNVFNTRYWSGSDPIFAAGTVLSPGIPRDWRVRVRWTF